MKTLNDNVKEDIDKILQAYIKTSYRVGYKMAYDEINKTNGEYDYKGLIDELSIQSYNSLRRVLYTILDKELNNGQEI